MIRFQNLNFQKLKDFEYFEPELVFDGKNIVFFDDQGNLIKFDENFKIVWKKKLYSKSEKKTKNPILTLSIKEKILIVFDNISKFYAVNLENGDLFGLKNKNPINSQIKILMIRFIQ